MHHRLTVLLFVSFYSFGNVFAQDAKPTNKLLPRTRQSLPDRTMVVCIHGQILEQAFQRKYERQLPFDRRILDARVIGSAKVTYQTELDFDRATNNRIPIRINGDINSIAKGYTGLFVSETKSHIRFQSELLIGFDEEFSILSGSARACAKTTVCSVSSNSLLESPLVSGLGPQFAPLVLPKYEDESARIIEKELLVAANDKVRPVLAAANKLFDFEDGLSQLAPNKDYIPVISKSDTHLQFRVGPNSQRDVAMPKSQIGKDVPVEVWIYPSANRALLADAFLSLDWVPESLLELLPELPKAIKTIKDYVVVKSYGEWDVIQIGRFERQRSRTVTLPSRDRGHRNYCRTTTPTVLSWIDGGFRYAFKFD